MSRKQQKAQPTRPPPPPLSARKRLLFGLIASLLPIAALCLVELCLRFCGLGGYEPMFRKLGPVPGGNLVLAEQGGAASWFFANPGRAGTSEQYTFVDPKPTNEVRVLLLGESAMQGYPEPRHLCASAFLQVMLQDAWPNRQVNVINLGTTAVASFPVLGILSEALQFQPDLVVIYLGHNEFFGTYGVASVGRAGARPWLLQINRWFHSLAIVQALQALRHRPDSSQGRTFMEEMMGQTYIAPDDSLRKAAANLLYENLQQMIRKCHARGAQVLICIPPSNERDLAPIGPDKLDHSPPADQPALGALVATAEDAIRSKPSNAIPALKKTLELDPNHARAHFLLGRAFADEGKQKEALEQYILARDLDSMPWRAPSQSINAILRAAQAPNTTICDLPKIFRDHSPGQAIGWELMDDHVHPTLRGQALIADAIVDCLTNFDGSLRITSESRGHIPNWEDCAKRLGTNIYDQYAVAHNMRLLFSAPFMRRNNDSAFRRFNDMADGLEQQMAPEIRDVLHEWQATKPFEGSRCPATAAVAQLLLKQDRYREALNLFEIAQRAVPQFSSWYLEYVYYGLLCSQKLSGRLGAAETQLAHKAIEQGHFLSKYMTSDTDFTQRYTGLLHFLCGEFKEAIPCLLAVQPRQTGIDRLALDQALVVCYLQTQQSAKAHEVLASGVEAAGAYAEQYKAMLAQLSQLEKRSTGATNAIAPR
jgi:lysophospholipase L1-like esterase